MKPQNLKQVMMGLDKELQKRGGFLIEGAGVDIVCGEELISCLSSWYFSQLLSEVEVGIYQYISEGHKPEGNILPNPNPTSYRNSSLGSEPVFTQEYKVAVRLSVPYSLFLPDCLGSLQQDKGEIVTLRGTKVLRQRFCQIGQNKDITLGLFEGVFTLLDSYLMANVRKEPLLVA